MADTIRMTLRAINWTEGEVGHVHLRMRPGECRVDWGDGRRIHTSELINFAPWT